MGEKSIVTVGCVAMATRFEIALWGPDEVHLRAAGEAALSEVQHLDSELSRFRTDSDIYEVNARAAEEAVPVTPSLFRLLDRAAELSRETQGAFDVTVAPLMQAWGFWAGSERVPDPAEVEAARGLTGMHLVDLDAHSLTVRFRLKGVALDLGAFGKGYAVEQAAAVLQEAGIGGALVHGGTSSVQAIGLGPDGSPWKVGIRHPVEPDQTVATLPLVDMSLSVSTAHGRAFTSEGNEYGHIIDPRTGRPSRAALLAAVVGPSAADGDALATALLVSGEPFIRVLAESRPDWAGLIVRHEEPHIVRFGIPAAP